MTKPMLLAIALTSMMLSHAFATQTEKLDFFVFLTTGKPTDGTPKEEIEKMQMDHLANFTRLAGIGELSAAGPCVDPAKTIRGIVVIQAKSIADAESKFNPDPFVTRGFMKAEMHQFGTIVGKLVIPADITKLDKYTIVIANQGEKWPAQADAVQHVNERLKAIASEQYASKKLGFAALFPQSTTHVSKNTPANRVAVMIFRGDDTAAVEKIVTDSGLTRDKAIEFQVFPQYLVKDAMPSE